MEQINLFETLYPNYEIKKPIRLIELFAGYGSQALALKYIDANFEHWKISEWAIKSIQAYKDLHFADNNIDYAKNKTNEEIINWLSGKISQNYNNPIFKDKIKKLDFRKIYNNMMNTNNIGSIVSAKGKDLEITDTDKYDYIMTYSFPCQDLSLAGKRAGMKKDSGTRSGLLWEVERLLKECENKPQILIMENVTQVHSDMQLFNSFIKELEDLGYQSYWQDLIATDYKIPQTRNRTFMISILGDYNYNFPKKVKLDLRLKDMLEDSVDEKYYLSDKMIKCFTNVGTGKYPRRERFFQQLKVTNEQNIAGTIKTTSGSRPEDNFILENGITEDLEDNFSEKELKLSTKNKSVEETIKGKELKAGDFLDFYNRNVIKNGVAGTITTRINASTTSGVAVEKKKLRIRKLTPRECGRLMGVKDEDISKLAVNQSNASLYHLFGDSIVTTCLMAIFSQLLNKKWTNYL